MTTFLNVKNNAASKLHAAIDDDDLSLTLLAGEGARFPSSNFHITIDDEILLCSSRTNDVLTITRAQESTGAAAHAKDAPVRLNITAAIIDELQSNKSQVIWKDVSERWNDLNRTADQDWVDLDLTPYTSAAAKFAIVLMIATCDAYTNGTPYFAIRKNGTTPTFFPIIYYPSVAGLTYRKALTAIIALDAGQLIEWAVKSIGVGQYDSELWILGYIE